MSSAVNNAEKMIELRSSDGETFMVDEKVAMQSELIKNIIDDGCGGSPIPVTNVTGAILAKVIEYCKQHVPTTEEEEIVRKKSTEEFDKEFTQVDQATLFDLILAANYLDIKGLLDMLCRSVAEMMKGKRPEEIRKKFNIKNDYTPEQEEAIRKENPWAFE